MAFTQEEIKRRARKLMQFTDGRATPNEVAIAARNLKRLLDEHGLTLEDLNEQGVIDGIELRVVAHFPWDHDPHWPQMLGCSIASIFDCQQVYRYNPCLARFHKHWSTDDYQKAHQLCMVGFPDDVNGAQATWDEVRRALTRTYFRSRLAVKEPVVEYTMNYDDHEADFWSGVAMGIDMASDLAEIQIHRGPTPTKAVAIRKKELIHEWMLEHVPGYREMTEDKASIKQSNEMFEKEIQRKMNSGAFMDGVQAGMKVKAKSRFA